jgi:hypothetical protein
LGVALLVARALTTIAALPATQQPIATQRVQGVPTVTGPAKLATPTTFAAACQGRNSVEHIYHPNRLILLEACVTAVGTVSAVRSEPDGDVHIQLTLDPGQDALLNRGNRAEQSGALVVEIVCFGSVSQQDAVDACANYTNTITLPPVGGHVAITGPHVLDTSHDWMEIHPVYEWHVVP